MKRIRYILPIVILLITISTSFGQNRFKASVIAGLNAAQINGDDIVGYNRLGIVAGLRGITILTEKSDLSIEMTFSQRGSRNDSKDFVDIEINLNFVEVPVLFNYKDWYIEDGSYYKVQVSGGLSYGRLIQSSAAGDQNMHISEVENFNKDNLSLVLGVEFFINPHVSFMARWNNGMTKLFNNQKHNTSKDALREHFLSFRAGYTF